jgi:hypothetical protein
MWYSEILDAWGGGGWGIFIALNHQTTVGASCCRWAHRTVRCASHVTQPLGFWSFWPLEALSSSGTGQSSVALDRHCSVSSVPLTCGSDSARTVHLITALLQSTVVRSSYCSAITPDSSVAHRTVWWIIAERAWRNPRVASSSLYEPGAPDTVRWHTGQSGAPNQSTLGFFAPLYLNPLLNIYWFVLNLYAPVEHIF